MVQSRYARDGFTVTCSGPPPTEYFWKFRLPRIAPKMVRGNVTRAHSRMHTTMVPKGSAAVKETMRQIQSLFTCTHSTTFTLPP